ncbi:MAG: biotin--[acetyl-CoA-carboxylase] ligase [Actinomycetota bacterium]|nr:biotin--[acetyl-CoA-carboxylase] ligase [Actinomycetota bacterium]
MASTDNNWQNPVLANMPGGWIVQRVAETGSTNADLYGDAQRDAQHHTALMADNQTAGRGRLDRTWEAQSGANLLVSLLFRKSHSDISSCQRIVAVSAVRACQKFLAESAANTESIKLKWPNDLLVNEKKFGGMLSVADAGQTFIVVGIGINIAWAPDYAAKLKDLTVSEPLEPVGLLRELLEQINIIEKFSAQQLHAEYVASLSTLNKVVRVELTNGQIVTGRAVALEPSGRLVIDAGNERHVIDTGDVVHLRDANHE